MSAMKEIPNNGCDAHREVVALNPRSLSVGCTEHCSLGRRNTKRENRRAALQWRLCQHDLSQRPGLTSPGVSHGDGVRTCNERCFLCAIFLSQTIVLSCS